MHEVNSCIYSGRLDHLRRHPVRHAFSHRLFMLYLDLDELPGSLDLWPLCSARRPALARFRRDDHLGPPEQPLAHSVRELVHQRLGRRPAGPVRLLTHLRYFGYCFNPVSVYFCHDADGALDALVLEVNNTPWRERHCYVLDATAAERRGGTLLLDFDKAFHVSPFMPMDMRYHWRFRVPGDRLVIGMRALHEGRRVFDAQLLMHRRPLERKRLVLTLLRQPAMTLKVIALIHYQALRLWLKRVPLFTHPARGTGNGADGTG